MTEAVSEPTVAAPDADEVPTRMTRVSGTGRGSLTGAFFVGLGFLPTFIGVGVAIFYFADKPENSVLQVAVGGLLGIVVWAVVSLGLRTSSTVAVADTAAYEELLTRLTSLEQTLPSRPGSGTDLCAEAREHVRVVREALRGGVGDGESPLRWLGGYGYINLWRHVHRAEEAMVQQDPKWKLYVSALQDEARLQQAPVDGREVLVGALRGLLGDPAKRADDRREALERLDAPEGRAIVREAKYVINCYRDDLWQCLVRLRNLLFETFVYTSFVCIGLLALAVGVLGEDYREEVASALAYYLIGAVVGLFAELYGTSRREEGVVHDYGLARARVLTIPVLSGIAAIGGVALARLGGTVSTSEAVSIEDVFSLDEYPFGVVVAAIFGLTPGLLLERLRNETDGYKKQLAESGPTQTAGGSTTAGGS